MKIAILVFAFLAIVALLLNLSNQRVANWVVSFLQNTFSLDFDSALHIYLRLIRNNLGFLIYATFGIFFIIDKFYRLDSARSSETGGTGLGLAIAKEIITSHGGKIYADCDNGYTAFTVELPGVDVASYMSL